MKNKTMPSDKPEEKNQISRRSFLKGLGVTSAGAAVLDNTIIASQFQKAGILKDEAIIPAKGTSILLTINGKKEKVFVEPRTTLAEAIRIKLELTGTKLGCERGACGACTVIIDGKPINSCMTFAIDAEGKEITTIEGLDNDNKLSDLQESFIEHDALQCGFCTSGIIMSSDALLKSNPSPSEDEIKDAISGNICRCGTYPKVFEAIKKVSKGK